MHILFCHNNIFTYITWNEASKAWLCWWCARFSSRFSVISLSFFRCALFFWWIGRLVGSSFAQNGNMTQVTVCGVSFWSTMLAWTENLCWRRTYECTNQNNNDQKNHMYVYMYPFYSYSPLAHTHIPIILYVCVRVWIKIIIIIISKVGHRI